MWMRWRKKIYPPKEPKMLELRWAGDEQDKAFLGLYPYCDEYWDRFPSVAVAVGRELFKDLQVLTAVHAFQPSSKNMQKYNIYSSEEMFLRTYFETLRLHRLANDLQYHKPGDLITQTKGVDIPHSTLLFSGDYGVFTYDAYGYTSLSNFETFQQMKEQIEKTPYMLHLDYGRHPDEITLTVNTEAFSLAWCISRIQDICQSLDVSLKIDPKLLQYIQ